MSDVDYRVVDLADQRVLTVDGSRQVTSYSERVVRMLVEQKGPGRAALYLPFKETRGRHFLALLLGYLRGVRAGGLSALEVGCSRVTRRGFPPRRGCAGAPCGAAPIPGGARCSC